MRPLSLIGQGFGYRPLAVLAAAMTLSAVLAAAIPATSSHTSAEVSAGDPTYGVDLEIVDDDVTLRTEGTTFVHIVVANTGDIDAGYNLSVGGLPRDVRGELYPSWVYLQPGTKANVTLRLEAAPDALEGEYVYGVKAYVPEHPEANDTDEGRLTVRGPVYAVSLDVPFDHVWVPAGGTTDFEFRVVNDGDSFVSVRLEGVTKEDMHLDIFPDHVGLAPGEHRTVNGHLMAAPDATSQNVTIVADVDDGRSRATATFFAEVEERYDPCQPHTTSDGTTEPCPPGPEPCHEYRCEPDPCCPPEWPPTYPWPTCEGVTPQVLRTATGYQVVVHLPPGATATESFQAGFAGGAVVVDVTCGAMAMPWMTGHGW